MDAVKIIVLFVILMMTNCVSNLSCSETRFKTPLSDNEVSFFLHGEWKNPGKEESMTIIDNNHVSIVGDWRVLYFWLGNLSKLNDRESQEDFQKKFITFLDNEGKTPHYKDELGQDHIKSCFEGRYELNRDGFDSGIVHIKFIWEKADGRDIPEEFGSVHSSGMLYYNDYIKKLIIDYACCLWEKSE